MSTEPAALVAMVAAHGLPGARIAASDALEPVAWRALYDLATHDRLAPLLAAAVVDGALPTTPAQREQAVAGHEQSMRLCLQLERALLESAATLAAAGIPFRVLKGSAVAHLDYRDPADRAFGDVDLLVEGTAYDDALAALHAEGSRRRYREVRPGFDRRWGKGACLVRPDGAQLDVHRTFVAGPFGLTVDLAELFAGAATLTVGGRDLQALDREGRFLHACFHAALGDQVPRLVALRDVAQLVLATDLDVEAALERARRWRADAVVARAVRLAWSRLELAPVPLSEWAAAHRPDRFQARALRAYTSPSRSYATQVVAGVAAVPTVSEKLAYMRALLLAEPAHLARRDRSYARRLRRAWRAYGDARTGPRERDR